MNMHSPIRIRTAEERDWQQWAALRHALWSDQSEAEHLDELRCLAENPAAIGPYPVANLVAEAEDGSLVGFLEAGMRSHADGCDPTVPVGYIEGWYVCAEYRRNGVGSMLMQAAEEWAREQGCVELASDTWLDNPVSEIAHLAAGFEVVDRCIHFRKSIR
jgi:aminoglycoside 6'-N-acetyltransferase I